MLKISKYGYKMIIKAFLMLVIFVLILFYPYPTVEILAAISFFWLVILLFFFRDPKREVPKEEGLILAPADGKIIAIEEVDEKRFFNTKVRKISIYLNMFNVHVNRMPVTGRVDYINYFEGKNFSAWRDKASEENEHSFIGITTEKQKFAVKQIAGLVANRIVYNCKVGNIVRQGDRFGIIKFGSRVELFLPLDIELKVYKGQKVLAGETVVGRMK